MLDLKKFLATGAAFADLVKRLEPREIIRDHLIFIREK